MYAGKHGGTRLDLSIRESKHSKSNKVSNEKAHLDGQ